MRALHVELGVERVERSRCSAADRRASGPKHLLGGRGRPAASQIGRSTAYAAAKDGSLPTIRVSSAGSSCPTAKLLAMIGAAEEE